MTENLEDVLLLSVHDDMSVSVGPAFKTVVEKRASVQ